MSYIQPKKKSHTATIIVLCLGTIALVGASAMIGYYMAKHKYDGHDAMSGTKPHKLGGQPTTFFGKLKNWFSSWGSDHANNTPAVATNSKTPTVIGTGGTTIGTGGTVIKAGTTA